MTYDLHTHSTRSDGTTAPATNAALAAAAGLRGIALTDHDTTAGWDEAAAACSRAGIEFVPGLELSTELEAPGVSQGGPRPPSSSVHLLGYWMDAEHVDLVAECARLRDERVDRAMRIVERLGALGVDVAFQRVLAQAAGAPVGRPHIAAELVALGVVADIDEAFAVYLADGGPAHVSKHALSPAEGIALIRAAGGAAVLAHPGAGRGGGGEPHQAPITEPLVAELAVAGLAGIEVDHPCHDAAAVARWARVADTHGLVATGSSDFHGEHKDVKIGTRTTAEAALEALRERTVPALRCAVDG